MPKNSKTTRTKEADEAALLNTEIARLQELLKLREQELAVRNKKLAALDGVISTSAATTDSWRDWRNLSNPPPVTSQAGSARTLDLNLEEEKDTLTQVKRILDQKTTDKSFIITPKFAEGTNDPVKHLRSVINADTDSTEPHAQVGPSVQEFLLSLSQLPAHQRRVLAAQLREVQQNTSIDQDSKAKIASGIIKELRTEARASEDNETSSTEEPSGVPELKEELKEELTTDLSSGIISTTASEGELRASDSGSDPDEVQDLDEMPYLLDEINPITLDDPKGTYFPEPGGDEGSYFAGSNWGLTPDIAMRDGLDKDAVTSVVTDSADLAGLLPTRPGGGLGCGSITVGMLGKFEKKQSFPFTSTAPSVTREESVIQEEPCAPTRALDNSNIENYNTNYYCSIVSGMNNDTDVGEENVDGYPPKGSEYDQIGTGEAVTIATVLAGTDVKEKDDTVIGATEGDTHGKIIGYNCGYYYDCDYWRGYDVPGENMEITPGTRLATESHLSPCQALLQAGISCSLGSRREAEPTDRTDGRSVVGSSP